MKWKKQSSDLLNKASRMMMTSTARKTIVIDTVALIGQKAFINLLKRKIQCKTSPKT